MFTDKTGKCWSTEENFDKYCALRRKYYKTQLALEAYCDNTKDKTIYTHPSFEILKQLRANFKTLAEKDILEMSQQVVDGFSELVNKIGKDKFVVYDDGDINYIWKK